MPGEEEDAPWSPMLWLCWESGAGCARGERHGGHGGSTRLPWGILAPWQQNNLQKCCHFRFPGSPKARSRCSRPQVPAPAPCRPSPCLFLEEASPSPRHAQPGGKSLQWQEEISEQFLRRVSVPRRPPLPFAFSFTSRQLCPGHPRCCGAGSWVYGPTQHGGLLAVVFALILSIQLSCSSADK